MRALFGKLPATNNVSKVPVRRGRGRALIGWGAWRPSKPIKRAPFYGAGKSGNQWWRPCSVR